jgi:hypothetical protein
LGRTSIDSERARRRWRRVLAFVALQLLVVNVALAWIYPEHRTIALIAVRTLDAERKAQFDALWSEARTGHERRLCAAGAESEQGVAPECIDWAAFSAIAGDHSCSSKGMLDTVLGSDWILAVADVAAQLKEDLSRIGAAGRTTDTAKINTLIPDLQRYVENETVRAQLVNALRTSDTRLQRADPQYATRAGSNGAHFLLPRPRTDITPREYAELTLSSGSEISAVGSYSWYHVSALQKATRLGNEQLAPAERQALARAMLADEAFALHFLEDTFAAGHVAGAWGDTSQRKGTHDYYNEAGLEAFTWGGGSTSAVLLGDAHMRPQDAERAAAAVRTSLAQVIDHASGRARTNVLPHTPDAPSSPDDFDVCKNNVLVTRKEGLRATPEVLQLLAEVLRATPIPSLGPGLGSMPRFRSEVGPFLGFAGSAGARNVGGGFVDSQGQNGWIGDVDLSIRLGLGLEGVLGDAGDGLVFASLGIRGDSPSSNKISSNQIAQQAGSLGAAIPNRMGISTRLRMPYYLIPGDLLFMSPLYLVSPTTYANMAVTASNGGLIPWQTGMATPIGRFQFVLGRELGVTFYGGLTHDSLIAPATIPGGVPTLVDFKSIFYELPILEYRPWRAFDTQQSSATIIQLFVGADVPHGVKVVSPIGAPPPHTKTVYSVGLRAIFDWRRY